MGREASQLTNRWIEWMEVKRSILLLTLRKPFWEEAHWRKVSAVSARLICGGEDEGAEGVGADEMLATCARGDGREGRFMMGLGYGAISCYD